MKKWSGGVLILALAGILLLRYCFIGKQPKKQTSYDFFNNHPSEESRTVEASIDAKLLGTEVKKPQPQVVDVKKRKKPHLIEVKGIHELYSSKNISAEELKTFLVWHEMRDLLSRSDALPETAQGVREGAIAWRELLSVIEKERASSNSDTLDHKDCPYTIDALSAAVPENGVVLQIPCGLVEDSSVTIIGLPDGHNGSFHIELIGSQFPEEAMPPVVLHYNVHVAGDNLTEKPMIVQNTWTNELGWGKEEQCPDHRSSNAIKVDELLKCNEEVVRSTREQNLTSSHPDSDKMVNVSNGAAHLTANFPFVEGYAFTATLWVGVEGFHMAVNGRHETSFAYRKNLEPWLVSGVKVGGGLNLVSALAKGLPVSNDFELTVDSEHLKAPPVSKKRLVMLIGVFSTGNNFERRMALRRSWMQYEAIRSGDVAVRFFIGLHKNKEVNFQLWKEAQAYGDIQLMPFVDYYNLLTLKTIAICIMGTKILPAKYIMKTDDDAFVRVDQVLSSLSSKAPDGLLYGLISFESSPHRDKDNKWHISAEEWPHETYPPWAHGPGYVISRDIAKFIVQGHKERDLQLFKLEDVAVGIWINQFQRQGRKVEYVNDDRFYNSGCETDYILAHYQNPRKVLCLWEMLQKEHKAECCE